MSRSIQRTFRHLLRRESGGTIDLDTPLLFLNASDSISVRDACQNFLFMGAIGSGKTTSGKTLLGSLFKSQAGGIALCAKAEEAQHIREQCALAGRSASLIEFDASGKHGFNFIAYELARLGSAGINSVIECIMRVLEMMRLASPSPGKVGDAFWESTTRQILRNALPVIFAAHGTVTIAMLLQYVRSAPRSLEEMADRDWQDQSFFALCFARAQANGMDSAQWQQAVDYWRNDFATLDAKTRGNVVLTLTTALDRFTHGWLAKAFCGDTTITPELTFSGAIILLNLPALTLNEDGIIAQQIFKFFWQRAVLTRNALAGALRELLVFCWADECQYFVNSQDAEFLSTSRGSRACTVYLTQSLPTLMAKMPGENARERVMHLLGNFGTKIWCSNSCADTNEWAAKTIGKTVQRRASFNASEGSNSSYGSNMGMGTNEGSNHGWGTNSSYSSSPNGNSTSGGSSWNEGRSEGTNESRGYNHGGGTNRGTSHGWSENVDFLVQPGFFARGLKTGGPANGKRVSAVWFQAGRTFAASGGNALVVEFQQ